MIHPDKRATAAACHALGIQLPVRVIFLPGLRSAGKYGGISVDRHHEIELRDVLTITAANAALWHELTHAAQCERLGGWVEYQREYRRQVASASDNSRGDEGKVWLDQLLGGIPLEREARNNEVGVATRCALWPAVFARQSGKGMVAR